jgi:hypothetical protein
LFEKGQAQSRTRRNRPQTSRNGGRKGGYQRGALPTNIGRHGACDNMLPSDQVQVDGAEALELDTRKVWRYAKKRSARDEQKQRQRSRHGEPQGRTGNRTALRRSGGHSRKPSPLHSDRTSAQGQKVKTSKWGVRGDDPAAERRRLLSPREGGGQATGAT